MKPIEIIAGDLFDKVRSRFSNLQMGDENGAVTANPPDARFFDFDFVIEGNNLGRVSISINELGNLKIFFSQGITEDADVATQDLWFDFLKEMRFFAKRRLMRFDTRDITKDNLDKTDFQYLAQNGPKEGNMNESSMFGSSKTSKKKVGETLLIVRHEGAIDPSVPGARSRKIKNLFVQNAEGERFKCPFAWLPLGRALQRHVFNGGLPHDEAGKDIIESAGKCLQLSSFQKHIRSKVESMNPDAHNISEKANAKLQSLRKHMDGLCGQKYYEAWRESFQPAGEEVSAQLDDATMESYKDTFTVKGFDESLAEVFPLIHAIMQEAGEIDLDALVSEAKEDDCNECGLPESRCECDDEARTEGFDAFESWASSVVEGTMAPDVMTQLQELMATELQLGANGELISTLQGIGIDDDNLFDVLEKLNPSSSSDLLKQIIVGEIEKTDPEAAQELASAAQGQQPQAPQPAPQQAPAPEVGAEVPQQEPAMAESQPPVQQKSPGGIGDVKTRKDWEKKRSQWDSKQSMEGQEGFDRETFHHWMADAAQRIARGEFKDEHEVAADLQNHMMGAIDPDMADKVAHRLFGHDDIAQHRVKPTSDIELPKDIDGEDDDAEFLNKLRGQARSGSIKPGMDTGEKDEDSIDPEVDPDNQLIEPEEEEKPKKGTPEEIARSIIGFYNREDGTWTKGRPGIVAHVAREFGDESAELAKHLIMKLSKDSHHTHDMAEMRRLAGMPVVEADDKGAWSKETPWKKATKKDPRGKVTNLSDKARRETEKSVKASEKK